MDIIHALDESNIQPIFATPLSASSLNASYRKSVSTKSVRPCRAGDIDISAGRASEAGVGLLAAAGVAGRHVKDLSHSSCRSTCRATRRVTGVRSSTSCGCWRGSRGVATSTGSTATRGTWDASRWASRCRWRSGRRWRSC